MSNEAESSLLLYPPFRRLEDVQRLLPRTRVDVDPLGGASSVVVVETNENLSDKKEEGEETDSGLEAKSRERSAANDVDDPLSALLLQEPLPKDDDPSIIIQNATATHLTQDNEGDGQDVARKKAHREWFRDLCKRNPLQVQQPQSQPLACPWTGALEWNLDLCTTESLLKARQRQGQEQGSATTTTTIATTTTEGHHHQTLPQAPQLLSFLETRLEGLHRQVHESSRRGDAVAVLQASRRAVCFLGPTSTTTTLGQVEWYRTYPTLVRRVLALLASVVQSLDAAWKGQVEARRQAQERVWQKWQRNGGGDNAAMLGEPRKRASRNNKVTHAAWGGSSLCAQGFVFDNTAASSGEQDEDRNAQLSDANNASMNDQPPLFPPAAACREWYRAIQSLPDVLSRLYLEIACFPLWRKWLSSSVPFWKRTVGRLVRSMAAVTHPLVTMHLRAHLAQQCMAISRPDACQTLWFDAARLSVPPNLQLSPLALTMADVIVMQRPAILVLAQQAAAAGADMMEFIARQGPRPSIIFVHYFILCVENVAWNTLSDLCDIIIEAPAAGAVTTPVQERRRDMNGSDEEAEEDFFVGEEHHEMTLTPPSGDEEEEKKSPASNPPPSRFFHARDHLGAIEALAHKLYASMSSPAAAEHRESVDHSFRLLWGQVVRPLVTRKKKRPIFLDAYLACTLAWTRVLVQGKLYESVQQLLGDVSQRFAAWNKTASPFQPQDNVARIQQSLQQLVHLLVQTVVGSFSRASSSELLLTSGLIADCMSWLVLWGGQATAAEESCKLLHEAAASGGVMDALHRKALQQLLQLVFSHEGLHQIAVRLLCEAYMDRILPRVELTEEETLAEVKVLATFHLHSPAVQYRMGRFACRLLGQGGNSSMVVEFIANLSDLMCRWEWLWHCAAHQKDESSSLDLMKAAIRLLPFLWTQSFAQERLWNSLPTSYSVVAICTKVEASQRLVLVRGFLNATAAVASQQVDAGRVYIPLLFLLAALVRQEENVQKERRKVDLHQEFHQEARELATVAVSRSLGWAMQNCNHAMDLVHAMEATTCTDEDGLLFINHVRQRLGLS